MSTGILSSALLLVFNIIKRYSHCKCCSYIFLTMNLNSSMMHKNYVSYNSQSKSCSARFTRPCLIYPVKSFKNPLLMLFGNSDTIVLDTKIDFSLYRFYRNIYFSTFVIITDRIVTKIIDCLLYTSPSPRD